MSIGRATRPGRPSSCSSMVAAGNAVRASLAAQGIVTVVPDYSVFPPARFPMFVEHAARAVRFARERSPQMGRAGSCMDVAQSGDACGINGLGRLKFQRAPDVELALGDSPIALQNYPLTSALREPAEFVGRI
jgi:hypothetical protein